MQPNAIQLNNCADWHADRAGEAWERNDWDAYVRHILICDRLRAEAVS